MPYFSLTDAKQFRKLQFGYTSGPILGGEVDLKDFTNIEEVVFANHRITSFKNYHPGQLTMLSLQGNEIRNHLPIFSEKLTALDLQNANTAYGNSFEGRLTESINKSTNLVTVDISSLDNATVNHGIFGSLPEFKNYTSLQTFNLRNCSRIDGEVPTLVDNTALATFDISGTNVKRLANDFAVPSSGTLLTTFSVNKTSLSDESMNRLVEAIYAKWGSLGSTSGNGKTLELGPVGGLTTANFNKLSTLRSKGWTITTSLEPAAALLDRPFLSAAVALSTRKLKGTATKVMRVRRTTDDRHATVVFDENGKTSLSSELTNVQVLSGENATTIANTYKTLSDLALEVQSPFDTPVVGASYNNFSGTPIITTNTDGSYNIIASASSSAGANGARIVSNLKSTFNSGAVLSEDDSYRTRIRVSGTVVAKGAGDISIALRNSTNSNGGGSFNGVNPSNPSAALPMTLSTTGGFSFEVFGNNDVTAGTTQLGGIELQLDTNQTITIQNLKIEFIKHRCTVQTWYDQSSNLVDVTNTTHDEQPSIVEDGAVLSGGLRFGFETDSGSFHGDQLDSTAGAYQLGDHDSAFSSMVVITPHNSSAAEGYVAGTATDTGGGRGSSLYIDIGSPTSNLDAVLSNANSISASESEELANIASTSSANSQMVISTVYNDQAVTIHKNKVGTATNTGTYTFSANTSADKFILGNRNNIVETTAATVYKGDIQEVIFFDGDQSGALETVETNAIEAFNIA